MEDLIVVIIVVIVIAVARKIKKAMNEAAEHANKYAEDMKRKRAGHDGAYVAGPTPGGKNTLQDLLRTLAEQAGVAQPQATNSPAPAAVQVDEEREGPQSVDLLEDYRKSVPATEQAQPVLVPEPAPVYEKPRKKKKFKSHAPAVSSDEAHIVQLNAVDGAQAVAAAMAESSNKAAYAQAAPPPARGQAFFDKIDAMHPWQRIVVFSEVFGTPVSMQRKGEDSWG